MKNLTFTLALTFFILTAGVLLCDNTTLSILGLTLTIISSFSYLLMERKNV